jgi:hypothetical protein
VFDLDLAEPLYVFFSRDERGRWRMNGLYFEGPLDSDLLRALSVPALEARANGPDLRPALERAEPELVRAAPGTRPSRTSARLKVPAGAKPDSFYRRVAEVYRRLAAESNRPAVELAEANDVPVTTSHRWVKEARRRGHLPPGQKGRRG